MKFYKLSYRDEAEGHQGYDYFTSKQKAEQESDKWEKQGSKHRGEIETLIIHPTKAGILRALNIYGGHPDNG